MTEVCNFIVGGKSVEIPKRVFLHLKSKFPRQGEDDLEQSLLELFKFIMLVGARNSMTKNLPISREIDLLWHECILQTKFYRELCFELTGCFIEHGTLLHDEMAESAKAGNRASDEDIEDAFSWLVSYRANFGEFSEKALPCWPIARTVMIANDWSLESMNLVLANAVKNHT